MEEDNIKLYNAVMKCTREMAEGRGRTDLIKILIDIKSLAEFDSLKRTDKDFAVGVVRVIEKDKSEWIEFFKQRGDI